MKKYIKTNEAGAITEMVETSADGYLELGYIACDLDIDSVALMSEYAYQGEKFVRYGARPSINHVMTKTGWAVDLTMAKANKSREIKLKCSKHIYAGFDCDALGENYHYPSGDKDQSNLTSSVLDSYNTNDPNWVTQFWCADSDGNWEYKTHTSEQIRNVGSSCRAFINSAIAKSAMLQNTVSQSTTNQELNQINWDS